MADLANIAAGLKTRLATITGLRALDKIPGNITAPCAWPQPVSEEYDDTFEGDTTILFRVVIAAGAISDIERAQTVLMGYLAPSGTGSIKAAIEADITLSGSVDSCRVLRWHDYGLLEMGALQFVGALLDVEVFV